MEKAVQYLQDTFGNVATFYYNNDLQMLVTRTHTNQYVKYLNTPPDIVQVILEHFGASFCGFWHFQVNDADTETTAFDAYIATGH